MEFPIKALSDLKPIAKATGNSIANGVKGFFKSRPRTATGIGATIIGVLIADDIRVRMREQKRKSNIVRIR